MLWSLAVANALASTPLCSAVLAEPPDMAKVSEQLGMGVDANKPCKWGASRSFYWTPLGFGLAFYSGGVLPAATLGQPQVTDFRGTPMMIALTRGDQRLLDALAPVARRPEDAVDLAAGSGNIDLAMLLVQTYGHSPRIQHIHGKMATANVLQTALDRGLRIDEVIHHVHGTPVSEQWLAIALAHQMPSETTAHQATQMRGLPGAMQWLDVHDADHHELARAAVAHERWDIYDLLVARGRPGDHTVVTEAARHPTATPLERVLAAGATPSTSGFSAMHEAILRSPAHVRALLATGVFDAKHDRSKPSILATGLQPHGSIDASRVWLEAGAAIDRSSIERAVGDPNALALLLDHGLKDDGPTSLACMVIAHSVHTRATHLAPYQASLERLRDEGMSLTGPTAETDGLTAASLSPFADEWADWLRGNELELSQMAEPAVAWTEAPTRVLPVLLDHDVPLVPAAGRRASLEQDHVMMATLIRRGYRPSTEVYEPMKEVVSSRKSTDWFHHLMRIAPPPTPEQASELWLTQSFLRPALEEAHLPLAEHRPDDTLSLVHHRLFQDRDLAYLLEQGHDPNTATAHGLTPLSRAISADRPTTVELLLAHGADADCQVREQACIDEAVDRRWPSSRLADLLTHGAPMTEATARLLAERCDTEVIVTYTAAKVGREVHKAAKGCSSDQRRQLKALR